MRQDVKGTFGRIGRAIRTPVRTSFVIYFIVLGTVLRLVRGGGEPLLVLANDELKNKRFLLWKLVRVAGFRVIYEPEPGVRVGITHYDSTFVENELPLELVRTGVKLLNAHCRDISKTHVQQVFKEVAGYGYAVDPLTHRGPMVVKSEINARHDGRIVEGPLEVRDPETVYQRVIDNTTGDSEVVDLRVMVIGMKLVFVSVHQRPLERRFGFLARRTTHRRVEDCLSAEEQSLIIAFCRAMRLDFVTLDIARDNGDGRIYILDANKTPYNPPRLLSNLTGIFMAHRATRAFREALSE